MAHGVPMDDRQIVAALCAQNASGWAAAYDTYAEQLHAYARSILCDHDAAADAVHDAFLIAGQRIRQLRDPERLRPWLYAIVRRECLRQLRTSSRNVELAEAGQVRDESVDLDAGLRAEHYRELIWTAAAGLNPREREVLELSARGGRAGRRRRSPPHPQRRRAALKRRRPPGETPDPHPRQLTKLDPVVQPAAPPAARPDPAPSRLRCPTWSA